jgi:hypothetical protein
MCGSTVEGQHGDRPSPGTLEGSHSLPRSLSQGAGVVLLSMIQASLGLVAFVLGPERIAMSDGISHEQQANPPIRYAGEGMRVYGCGIIGIAVLAATWSEPAASFTGGELLDVCSQNGVSGHLACSFYVRGLVDGLAYASIWAGSASKYCPPRSVQVNDIRAIVEKYLAEHRNEHNNEAGALAGAALYQAFRCNKSH